MKTLIVLPSFKILGGVSNHYEGLAPFWSEPPIYSFQGKRPHIPAVLTLIPDYIGFIYKIIRHKPEVVIVNPSLARHILLRDSMYPVIARALGCKVVTFFHGWLWPYAETLETKRPLWFRKTFGASDLIFVLYSKFSESLHKMGVKSPTALTTTKVADNLFIHANRRHERETINNILFLARIELRKGIFILLDAFKLLQPKYPHLKLIVCGSGTAEKEVNDYIRIHNINNVEIRGKVSGEALARAYLDADLYVLPSYSEGMATTVLEAMAFGLPVISRPVGGVNDFFEQGKMGSLPDTFDSRIFADEIEKLINEPATVKAISTFNRKYAEEHFKASAVTANLETTLNKHFSAKQKQSLHTGV